MVALTALGGGDPVEEGDRLVLRMYRFRSPVPSGQEDLASLKPQVLP